jgi:hypothetical protein
MRYVMAIALLAATAGAEAAGPPVQLALRDGMVWLVARDATLGQVFVEWERVGQTRVVNAERLTGRVSLELNGVPEGQALDMLLRTAGGFIAVQRSAVIPTPNGLSQFEQIVIMPGRDPVERSASAAAPAATPPLVFQPPLPSAVQIAPGVQRLLGPDGQPVPDDQDDAPVTAAPRRATPSLPPGFATPPQAPPAPAPASQTGPVGVPVPGMIVPPRRPPQ